MPALIAGPLCAAAPGTFDEVGCARRVDVLPDSKHQPSISLESPVVAGITSAVQGKLFAPPRCVRPGSDRVVGTTVPEAAVHLDSDPGPAENDVGPAGQTANIDPVAKASAVQLPPERKFGFGASCPQPGHEGSDLRRGRWWVSSASYRRGH